jgi:hypothetical protein
MCRALHLGVQKALDMVVSHYRVNLGAISTGYVIPIDVDDEVEMNCMDTLTAPTTKVLTEDFMEFFFLDAPRLAVSRPKNSWAFKPFKSFVRTEPCGFCNELNLLKTFGCL